MDGKKVGDEGVPVGTVQPPTPAVMATTPDGGFNLVPRRRGWGVYVGGLWGKK